MQRKRKSEPNQWVVFSISNYLLDILTDRGVGTEKLLGGHPNIGGAQRGYFRNFGLFYGFFIAFSEIVGGTCPPAPQ